jgi:hypothetical protein
MTGTINDLEWNDITNFLYKGSDSTALCLILKRLAKDNVDSDIVSSSSSISPRKSIISSSSLSSSITKSDISLCRHKYLGIAGKESKMTTRAQLPFPVFLKAVLGMKYYIIIIIIYLSR